MALLNNTPKAPTKRKKKLITFMVLKLRSVSKIFHKVKTEATNGEKHIINKGLISKMY